MPTYTFVRKSTQESWEETMKISEMSAILESDPDLDVLPGNPLYGDLMSMGRIKPSEEWRGLLGKMKKFHKGNNIEII